MTKTILAALLCAAAAGLGIYNFDGAAAVATAIPAGAVAYVLAIRFLRLITPEDVRILMDTAGGKLPRASRPLVNSLLNLVAPG